MGRFHAIKGTKHIIQSIMIRSSRKKTSTWHRLSKNPPINLHNFCQKYLVSNLANRTNLKRWKIPENNNFELCNYPEMQPNIFNNWLALDWYKWRRNTVISTICNHLKTKVTIDLLQLYADIDGYINPAFLFKRCAKLLQPTWMKTSGAEPGLALCWETAVISLQ